ncbi:universal stress protein [Ectothiorhodospira lacustris]|uniref:universal stress protein n=1 Tax=Ectothiorhodospira lacustris TaxID=2899127 RepID=UPI001EE950B5|nr:universal stress protein [Ectothiorhodospira lacustris]MCG5501124.1 universal stress protein [Ectothiorhodospira lacustris]MCG5511234.1 universal stress protein [Ectothiorhodospira lacustris]MCG5522950.1 universal stress protein [Ectothiorhodospira lacustris]
MSAAVTIPLDSSVRSQAALRPGLSLAGQLGLRVRLASVVSRDQDAGERKALLQSILAARGLNDGLVEVITHASVTDGVMELIGRDPDSPVVMSTHARGLVGEAVAGSVASHMVRHTHRPLLFTGPEFAEDWTGPIRTLLVCLDGSPLSEAMLPEAVSFARAIGADIRLIQVLKPSFGGGGGADSGEWVYLRRVADHVPDLYGMSVNWDVLHGKDVAQAVVDYSALIKGAVIAMTTHGRTGLQRALMGSFAREVVRAARSPVLVMRPEDKS